MKLFLDNECKMITDKHKKNLARYLNTQGWSSSLIVGFFTFNVKITAKKVSMQSI